ncbi:cystathionine beta-lyase, partial [Burkholderia sola]
VVPYELPSMRSCPTPQLRSGTVVRFAIGLEAVQDLRADLEQALAAAFA